MTAEATYQFLKPSLEQLSQKEKEELCRLISGTPEPIKEVKDDVHSVAYYKKKLLKTVFNKNKKKPLRAEVAR